MSIRVPEIDKIVKVLSTYAGRDKALRSVYFALLILVTKIKDEKFAQHIFLLAKQLSATRLVMRQLNHLPLLSALTHVPRQLHASADPIDTLLAAGVSGTYAVQAAVEFCAWLADARAISVDAARWFRWSLYLWIVAMGIGVLRLLRRILYVEPLHDRAAIFGFADNIAAAEDNKLILHSRQADRISLVGIGSDLIAGIASLPHRFLWAGRLSKQTHSTFSLVASLIGLYKCF